ncbi:MAG: carboxymuconolactone decarboxylase family protein [Candidatus Bipolaricaulis anaerobius]|nr:carboxymuconolactone decarboxylase family protein [Candidatus Bipolaricaulis anaerobius]HOD73983.1 carboxymuconolactone decarboxylase family protein [Candidatus Bipolaricaulis anaerobius]
MGKREEFFAERERLNEIVLKRADLVTKRLFALDAQAYEDGALPRKVKELLGLVASLILRCDDCITYHVVGAWEAGATGEELMEAMSVALVVGGSIVIPHLRRAAALVDELEEGTDEADRDRA